MTRDPIRNIRVTLDGKRYRVAVYATGKCLCVARQNVSTETPIKPDGELGRKIIYQASRESGLEIRP